MIEIKNICHKYGDETVLHGIDLTIEKGSFTILAGESGSGKSTLLSIVSTLLKPTEGSVLFEGKAVAHMPNLDSFRNMQIGFVFQFHYLISYLTVYENVAMVTRRSSDEIDALLERLGIAALKNKYPDEISGGQRQRAAIARAMINEPAYIFADEPTGNLDSVNTASVFSLLRQTDATVIVATHDLSQVRESDRIITLKDGKVC